MRLPIDNCSGETSNPWDEMLLTQSDSWFVLFHPLTDNFGTGELCALFHCSGESRGPKMKGERRFISAGHSRKLFNHPRLDISTDWNRTKVGNFTTQNGTDHGGSGSDLRWRSFYQAPFPTRVQALETLLRSGWKWLAASKISCTDVPGLLLQGRMLLPDEEGVGASSWAARVTGSYWFCIFSILRYDLGDTPVPSHGVSFLALFNGRNPGTNAPVWDKPK